MIPAVLSTSECYDYVGGRPIFEELQALYGRMLKPLRTTPRGDQTWLRETVEAVLRAAASEGSLSDRPRVEAALREWRQRRAATRPSRQTSPP
jgi:hypothetical protein